MGTARLLALGGFARAAGVGGTGQHAVFGRHPTLARAFLVGWHPVFDRSGAQHTGVAKFNEYRAFGVFGELAGDAHGAQGIGQTAIVTGKSGHKQPVECER